MRQTIGRRIGKRYGRRAATTAAWVAVVLVVLLTSGGAGFAGEAAADRRDPAVEDRARALAEGAQAIPDRLFAGRSGAAAPAVGVTIVASFGLEDDELQTLMAEARRVGYPIVTRGVWRGSLPETTARLKRLAGERGERAPAMTIDPPLVRRLGVDAAPALVLRGPTRTCVIAGRRPLGDLIARAAREWPAFRPWADAAARALARRDTKPGRVDGLVWPGDPPACRVRLEPPPIPLAEPDLAEALREAVLRHDWAGELARARETTRRRLAEGPGLNLPRARTAGHKTVDLTVEVRERIVEPKTRRVLAEPGQRIDPLAAVPWRNDLWIIDATDPAQVRWAEERAAQEPAASALVLIAKGDAVDLMRRWGRPVQWLPPELADRLQIEAVPAVVRANATGQGVEVDTYAVSDRTTSR